MLTLALCVWSMLQVAVGGTINFTDCQSPNWKCLNDSTNDVIYTCPTLETDFTIHVKDYRLAHNSVTVKNCKHIKVVMDCASLQGSSRLSNFVIRDCDKLEFIIIGDGTLSQPPPQLTIENVKEVLSLPRGLYTSLISDSERDCLEMNVTSKSLKIVNSKINFIREKAIYNATGIRKIEFINITIDNIENRAINAFMVGPDTFFKLENCKISNLKTNSVIVETNTATLLGNNFGDILLYAVNITAENIELSRNSFKKIDQNGFSLLGTVINITDNNIDTLASNALIDIKCSRRKTGNQYLNFSNNTLANIRPYSLWFDYASCKSSNSSVTVKNNKMQCKCQDLAFLTTTSSTRQELNNLILDLNNNNTCLSAPCLLPIEVVKILVEDQICQFNLDMRVTCLLYYDKKPNVTEAPEEEEEEEATEPVATFYLIRQATVPNGSASAAMMAIDREALLRDTRMNFTQRTPVNVVFDASKDFADMIRSTSAAHRGQPKPAGNVTWVRQCTGTYCRNNTFDKQKAIDFYKFLYAQLRPPRPTANKNTNNN